MRWPGRLNVPRGFTRAWQALAAWVISLHIPSLWARRIATALFLYALLVLIIDHYVAPHSISERTALVQALAQVAGAIGLVVTLTLTARQLAATTQSLDVSRSQLDVARDAQRIDRFAKGIEQLGSDKMEIRMGGIFALEQIARDSDQDYGPIIEILCAFLRARSALKDKDDPTRPVPSDEQAALTVIGRRRRRYKHGEDEQLALTHLFIPTADLSRAQLAGAFMVFSTLSDANFTGADITETDLRGVDLTNANVTAEQLATARIDDATLLDPTLRAASSALRLRKRRERP